MNISTQSINLLNFGMIFNSGFLIRHTLISPAGAGLWEKYSFIYLGG